MKIAPCPNPKCRGTSIVLRPTLGTTSYNTYVSGDSYAGIRPVCDDCQLAGPWCRDKPEAIAAWNSISMTVQARLDGLVKAAEYIRDDICEGEHDDAMKQLRSAIAAAKGGE